MGETVEADITDGQNAIIKSVFATARIADSVRGCGTVDLARVAANTG